eukprot:TRINITY_DN17252_c0_g1_i2.p1 TRINITY_DN17252_c0_g1~~TRINITY_DN17252_c0_g1_i2.p1  ORF type:complete len:648 (-),score=136.36 TRINITY_DN17252_c0_g1_i2:510-2453(-)
MHLCCDYYLFFFLRIRRPPRSTLSSSSAASDVYKRQASHQMGLCNGTLCPDGENPVRADNVTIPDSLKNALAERKKVSKLNPTDELIIQMFFLPAVVFRGDRAMCDPDRLSSILATIGIVEDVPWDTYLDVAMTPSRKRSVRGLNKQAGELFEMILDRVESVALVEAFVNERRDPMHLSEKIRHHSDPPKYTDSEGREMSSADFSRPGLHNGWQWLCEWQPDLGWEWRIGEVNACEKGWRYSETWDPLQWELVDSGINTPLRRRKLFRVQLKLHTSGGDVRVSRSRNMLLHEAFRCMCTLQCLPQRGVPPNCVHKDAGGLILVMISELPESKQFTDAKLRDLMILLGEWDEYAASGNTWADRTLADGYMDVDGFVGHALQRTAVMDDNRFMAFTGAIEDAVFALRNIQPIHEPEPAPRMVVQQHSADSNTTFSSSDQFSSSNGKSPLGASLGEPQLSDLADRKLGGMAARRAAATNENEQSQIQADMQTQMDILERQEAIERIGSNACELAANTAEAMYGQKKQTEYDNKKLHAIQEQLSGADDLIQNMERSMWSSGKNKGKKATPPMNEGDVEFDVKIKRAIKDKRRKIRLSRIGLLQINKDSVEEAKRFSALLSIEVLPKSKIQLVFRNTIKGSDKPEVCCVSPL